jgi:pimeloyl-ACP methyl ester carboxylesterase
VLPSQVTLVVVHGILSDSGAWNPLLDLLGKDSELAGHVQVVRVDYPSKLFELDPKKTVPDIDALGEYLGTELAERLAPGRPVVFAAHSMGGLVVQRYLAQRLAEGRGLELADVRRVLMFATPNSGSEFFLALRKWGARHRQENELRPLNAKIIATQKTIVNQIVRAIELTANSVPIPIEAYAGASDGVVSPQSARSIFTHSGVLPGDHSSIIRPASPDDLMYRIVKTRLLQEVRPGQQASADVPVAARVVELQNSIDDGIRAQHSNPTVGNRLDDDAVKQIATVLAEIRDLQSREGRQQFVMSLPGYIRERLPGLGVSARLDLGAIVRLCADFGANGRQALVASLEWACPPQDVAFECALAVINQVWPPAGTPSGRSAEATASHSD